jgi:hypothetical protein
VAVHAATHPGATLAPAGSGQAEILEAEVQALEAVLAQDGEDIDSPDTLPLA